MSNYDPHNTVRCQVCFELKHHSKYRRHLRNHVKNGAVSPNKVEEIIFQTKYAYKNVSKKSDKVRDGQICIQCGIYVLDLATHLRKAHLIEKEEDIFNFMKNSLFEA